MAHGTQTIYGHGFRVTDVPNYLDEGFKRAPHGVYKARASAIKKAAAEADWSERMEVDEVESVEATQIPGFPDLWFVVWTYTDEQAAKSKAQHEARLAVQRRNAGL